MLPASYKFRFSFFPSARQRNMPKYAAAYASGGKKENLNLYVAEMSIRGIRTGRGVERTGVLPWRKVDELPYWSNHVSASRKPWVS